VNLLGRSYLNKIFEIEYFPEQWSKGLIVPIHKKGSLSEVDNFRGITLLSVFGKLFTNIINKRLCTWATEYIIYVETQSGFRAKMGTNDNIVVIHSLITHIINSNKQLFCAFIDFSKAFDYVVRDSMWYKLFHLVIRGKMLILIQSIYSQEFELIQKRVRYLKAF